MASGLRAGDNLKPAGSDGTDPRAFPEPVLVGLKSPVVPDEDEAIHLQRQGPRFAFLRSFDGSTAEKRRWRCIIFWVSIIVALLLVVGITVVVHVFAG
mmetsp:Transcript_26535/g.21855  ORF Transcript_26535/g.21855 Transcript_26535/m.21855 type:complete len:98 (+) Transcript_26535:40-333(+)